MKRTIYEELLGDVLVHIVELGVTVDHPPQHYGHLTSTNTRTWERKKFTLLYDDNQCLITAGIEEWGQVEERALQRAGFSS